MLPWQRFGRAPLLRSELADADGLVAIGGDLRPERLLEAYRHGVFPWFGADDPVCWWSPDPRGIFELDGLHISRRLARTIRSGRFRVSVDEDFMSVIRGCAARPPDETWITAAMIAAYEELHRLGHAHSVEVWDGAMLAGGVYGVTVGGLFAGESMFHRSRDASKVALVGLVKRLRARNFQLFDVQFVTPHTARLGAVEIARVEYLARLRRAVQASVAFV